VKYGYNDEDYGEKISVMFEKKLKNLPYGIDLKGVEVEVTDLVRKGFLCKFDEIKGLQKCTLTENMHII
jgi:hypothetical protein